MMNAEATAENRPAFYPCQRVSTKAIRRTHEDKGCVQILVVLLHEFPVVLLGLLTIVLKEPSPVISLGG